MAQIKMVARLLTLGKPDAAGTVYLGPIDLSSCDPTLRVEYDSAPVGAVVLLEQDEETVTVIYEVCEDVAALVLVPPSPSWSISHL